VVLLACLVLVVGCRGAGQVQWNPAALVDAAFGGTAQAETERAWDRWAADHLQSGDVAFVFDDGYFLLGLVNFSKLSTDLTQCNFSHVALIAREDGCVVVYEMVMAACGESPLGNSWATASVRWR
jgi:hypothetical protein